MEAVRYLGPTDVQVEVHDMRTYRSFSILRRSIPTPSTTLSYRSQNPGNAATETLPTGEGYLAVEFGFRRAGILRVIQQDNFKEVLRQAYEAPTDFAADLLNNRESAVHIKAGQRVSIPTIREWLDICESEHGLRCRPFKRGSGGVVDVDILLIDVNERRLVRASSSYRYFALSYVWGNSTTPKTLQANLRQRFERGSLPQRFPATIEDAISLVKSLNEHYLWVDSLCVVQDDAVGKHQDIQKMDVVYSKAFATIVVLHGSNDNAGLPGIRPGTRSPQWIENPRSQERIIEADPARVREFDMLARTDREKHQSRTICNTIGAELREITTLYQHLIDSESASSASQMPRASSADAEIPAMVSHPPSLRYVLQTATWNTRGWTLQERLLSRRCLYFSTDYVYFQCGEKTLCETGGNLLTWADVTTTPHAANRALVAAAQETNPLLHFKWQPSSNAREPSATRDNEAPKRHNFDIYKDIVEMYSRRELSYPTDALNAVTGILTVVHNTLGGEMISGLPSSHLDLALLWTPAEPHDRRQTAQDGVSFPSWSWADWTGAKQYLLLEDGKHTYHSLEQEYAMSEIDSFQILHHGYFYKIIKSVEEMKTTESRNLADYGPPIEKPFSKYIPYSERKRYNVQFADLGPNVLQFWTYAVSRNSFSCPELEGIPLCDAEHGNVQGKQVVNRMFDSKQRYCGLIFQNTPKTSYRNKPFGNVEFILISSFMEKDERRSGLKTMDPNLRPYDERAFPWKGKGSGLVNIMAIEWIDEIAERLTVAQMHRQAWEDAKPNPYVFKQEGKIRIFRATASSDIEEFATVRDILVTKTFGDISDYAFNGLLGLECKLVVRDGVFAPFF